MKQILPSYADIAIQSRHQVPRKPAQFGPGFRWWRGLKEIRGARMARANFLAVAIFQGWKIAGVPATTGTPTRTPKEPAQDQGEALGNPVIGVAVTLPVGTTIGEARTTGVGAAKTDDGATIGTAVAACSFVIEGTGPFPPLPPHATSKTAATPTKPTDRTIIMRRIVG